MGTIEIRLLTTEDVPAFWELRLEALTMDPGAFGSSAEDLRAMGVSGFAARLAGSAEDKFVVGAFDDGSLVATAGFARESGPKEGHKGRIWGVYATPRVRGQGLAGRVMRLALERAARCTGIEQITLQCRTGSVAMKLYESVGFRSYGQERHALKIGDIYIDEDLMVLDVSAR